MFRNLMARLARDRPDLVIMEGTGLAGGAALLAASAMFGTRYVVSSGDAVGPFVAGRVAGLGPLFSIYERLLYARSAGFIGWSPYLVGRALTFGAPRAMTAAGWAPFPSDPATAVEDRARIRKLLSIPPEALVIGIAGSLAYTRRVSFCYGMELARAIPRVRRDDVYGLIVGDGSGRPFLEEAAKARPDRLLFAGRVDQKDVPAYLAAMDLGSLPQSVDGVGSFRYTTKLSEYLGAGLPVVTGQIPLAYDFGGRWLFRLPGKAPWSEQYLDRMVKLLEGMTPQILGEARSAVPRQLPEFDRDLQVKRVGQFIQDLLG